MLSGFNADIASVQWACEQLGRRVQDEYVIQTQRCLRAEAARGIQTAAELDATIAKNPHLPVSWAEHCLSAAGPRLAAVALLASEIAEEDRLVGPQLLGLVRSHLACACEDVVAASGLREVCKGLERVAGVKLAAGLVEGWSGGFGPGAGDDEVLRALAGPGRSATRLATVGRVSAVLRGLREARSGEGRGELEAGDEACVRRAAALLSRGPGAAATDALAARLEALAQARLWRAVMQAPGDSTAAGAGGGLLPLLVGLRRWCLLGRGGVFRQALHPGSDAGALRAPSNAIPLRTMRCPAPRGGSAPLRLSGAAVADARVTEARLGAAWARALAETAEAGAGDPALWAARAEEDALAAALLDGAGASAADRAVTVALRAPSLALLLPRPAGEAWACVAPCCALALGARPRLELQATLPPGRGAELVLLVGAGFLATDAPASAGDAAPFARAAATWSAVARRIARPGADVWTPEAFRDAAQAAVQAETAQAGRGGCCLMGAVTLRAGPGGAWAVAAVTAAAVAAEPAEEGSRLRWRALGATRAECGVGAAEGLGEGGDSGVKAAGAGGDGDVRVRVAVAVRFGGLTPGDAASLSASVVPSSPAAAAGEPVAASVPVPADWARWAAAASADEAAALADEAALGAVARVGAAPLPGLPVPVACSAVALVAGGDGASAAVGGVQALSADTASCGAAVEALQGDAAAHVEWMAACGDEDAAVAGGGRSGAAAQDAWWHSAVPARAAWPLSLVVGRAERSAYESLSCLLTRHRRAIFRLDDCWARLRLLHTAAAAGAGASLLRRPAAPSRRASAAAAAPGAVAVPGLAQWCARASLGLWAARSLAAGVESVWHASVLEPASARLFRAAAASRDFSSLLRAHRRFLAAAAGGMLLANAEAARSLASLQEAAARLHTAVCRVSSAVADCQPKPSASAVLGAARAVADTGGELARVAAAVAEEGRALALVAAALPAVDRSDDVATAAAAAWAEFAASTARPAAAASARLARP